MRARFSVAHKFRWGDTRPRPHARKTALAAAFALLGAIGCGEGVGVDENAVVSVYEAAPRCEEAERELARADGRAGDVRVHAVCLPATERAGRLDLGQVGANARRAVEDSTTVGYIGEPDPAATRFSAPILEAAGIAQVSGASGTAAMSTLLLAIGEVDDAEAPRDSVHDVLASSSK